ncbi:MAG: hypothetical protein HQK51_19585 [Oligoflexia bacterium]|nr:hypothetical protein [Oligoflexia bacterium]
MVGEALCAQKILLSKNIKARLINNPFVNHPNVEIIAKALGECKNRLLTVEDHQVIAGMGSILSHALLMSDKSLPFKLVSLGVRGHFGRSAYTANELYKWANIGSEAIAAAAECFINSTTEAV